MALAMEAQSLDREGPQSLVVWQLVAKCARAVHDPVARSVAILDQLLPPSDTYFPDEHNHEPRVLQGLVFFYCILTTIYFISG